jgi:VIT1/CCC1 family predicted Fe2+/Mn2+ transporter
MALALSPDIRARLLTFQRNEITEYHIYRRLARTLQDPDNRRVLESIADDERRHYERWKAYSGQDVAPDRIKLWKYYLISRLLGFTFGIKLMERGEEGAQENYASIAEVIEEARQIARDENEHEEELIAMLDEERLQYMGSIVLGLNDALVELTGALAGLTLALRNTNLIALTGSITGIAAALSMGASEYLSTSSEETEKDPIRASVYTGITYMVTVLLLILPYLLFGNYLICLALTLGIAVLIIAAFNYYVSVAKDEPFRRRFLEMAGLSLSIAALSFGIGYLLRTAFGIEF